MTSPVTTKRGDSGTTLILGGQRLSKSHPILETTGKVDSLRAHTALLRLQLIEQGNEQQRELVEPLFWLLHCYFLIGTAVNDPECVHPEYRQTDLGEAHLARLESIQTALEGKLALPKSFIVSASNTLSAQADVTATVARELERSLVQLKEEVPAFDVVTILAFVNRLSDSLYIRARFLEQGDHVPVDYGVLE
ncbi:MAG: ATP:cob(I)alamin adenosyltransferase [Candidatus Hydrogenedentes bacterium]|nr:ATP:cob(I)alamin adenosyltransferase [Candidatus Hydrogenedentota bacterium]